MNYIIQLLCVLFITVFAVDADAQTGRGKITAAEFFFDTDPGLGSGTPLSLQGNINDVLRTAVASTINSLPAGKHTLKVRLKIR
jgi:hypothetical protein